MSTGRIGQTQSSCIAALRRVVAGLPSCPTAPSTRSDFSKRTIKNRSSQNFTQESGVLPVAAGWTEKLAW